MMKQPSICLGARIVMLFCGSTSVPSAEAVDTKCFWIDWTSAEESAVGLPSFLDAPAGKDGFIRVEKEHLVRPDGERFPIWGVNICSGYCFPPKENAPAIAADLSRYGINSALPSHGHEVWWYFRLGSR